MTKAQKQERDEAIERLREWLKPGDTVHTVLRHVSRSGMSRRLDVYKLHEGDRDWLTYNVAVACGLPFDRKTDTVTVGGCGFDAGFHVVYELGMTLWPQGFECIGERCRSNDHSNGDRNRTPHHHQSGGYALRHEWL